MLAVVRITLVMLLSICICSVGLIYCLFRPRNPHNVATFGLLFSCLAPIFGIRIELRQIMQTPIPKSCIYVSNHQNNYDIIIAAHAIQKNTVILGKKSIIWIPLFGPLYWLAGNLFIDRSNNTRAHNTLTKIIKNIKKQNISIWVFPEGTRSRGRGLLPFKTGAFYIAIVAGVPVVPICISNITIKLNRWSNGRVIIEMLPLIDTKKYSRKKVRELTNYCYDTMKIKLDQLNSEIATRDF